MIAPRYGYLSYYSDRARIWGVSSSRLLIRGGLFRSHRLRRVQGILDPRIVKLFVFPLPYSLHYIFSHILDQRIKSLVRSLLSTLPTSGPTNIERGTVTFVTKESSYFFITHDA